MGIEGFDTRLPPTFRNDPLVRDNLDNLATDMVMWGVS